MSAFGTPFGQLAEIYKQALATQLNETAQTQGLLSYPLRDFFENGAKEHMGPSIQWGMRVRHGGSGMKPDGAYQTHAPVKDDYTEAASMKIGQYIDDQFVFDSIELSLGNKTPFQIFDGFKEAMNARKVRIAESIERLIAGRATNQTYQTSDNVLPETNGLRGLIRRSMTSGGVFTATTRPTYTGIYNIMGDGSVSDGKVHGVDATLAKNQLARGLVASHNGVMDLPLVKLIKDTKSELSFSGLSAIDGNMSSDSFSGFLTPEMHRGYEDIIANHGPSGGDFYNDIILYVKQIKLMPTPVLREDTALPIYLLRKSGVRMVKRIGFYGTTGKKVPGKGDTTDDNEWLPFSMNSTSAYQVRRHYFGLQLTNPQMGAAVIHGSSI